MSKLFESILKESTDDILRLMKKMAIDAETADCLTEDDVQNAIEDARHLSASDFTKMWSENFGDKGADLYVKIKGLR
jgi:DNA polymerase III delta subunit